MSGTATSTEAEPRPGRSDRLLALLRKLIDYGKELAATLQQRNLGTDLVPIMRSFGTADIAHILARVLCGLHRAHVLQDRIVQSTTRLNSDPKAKARPSRQPRAVPTSVRPTSRADPEIAALPTPEQIAAKACHQPIGAVIADICRDLGILPRHPLWRELQQAINAYRGNYARLVVDILKRPLAPPRTSLRTR